MCVTILYYFVFFNSIKPDEVGKPIANETWLQFWHNKEFSSLYITLIDRKPTSFIIFTMEGDTTISSKVTSVSEILHIICVKFWFCFNACHSFKFAFSSLQLYSVRNYTCFKWTNVWICLQIKVYSKLECTPIRYSRGILPGTLCYRSAIFNIRKKNCFGHLNIPLKQTYSFINVEQLFLK